MHDSLKEDQLYVTVDMMILTVWEGKLNLLLSQRKDAPYAGQWALPGRFVGLHESAETDRIITLSSACERPEPLPLGLRDGEIR